MHPLKSLYIEKMFIIILVTFFGSFLILFSFLSGIHSGFNFGNSFMIIVGVVFILSNIGWLKHFDERQIAIQNAIEADMYKNIDAYDNQFQ